jgi:hypothetical protein
VRADDDALRAGQGRRQGRRQGRVDVDAAGVDLRLGGPADRGELAREEHARGLALLEREPGRGRELRDRVGQEGPEPARVEIGARAAGRGVGPRVRRIGQARGIVRAASGHGRERGCRREGEARRQRRAAARPQRAKVLQIW